MFTPLGVNVILELALPGLIADRAIEGVVLEVELEHPLSASERWFTPGVDDLSFHRRRDTGGEELGSPLHLHQTETALGRS
jgi:hypothetical protein